MLVTVRGRGNAPLNNAAVTTLAPAGGPAGATSGSGEVMLSGLPPGTIRLKAEAEGYRTREITVRLPVPNSAETEPARTVIALEPVPAPARPQRALTTADFCLTSDEVREFGLVVEQWTASNLVSRPQCTCRGRDPHDRYWFSTGAMRPYDGQTVTARFAQLEEEMRATGNFTTNEVVAGNLGGTRSLELRQASGRHYSSDIIFIRGNWIVYVKGATQGEECEQALTLDSFRNMLNALAAKAEKRADGLLGQ